MQLGSGHFWLGDCFDLFARVPDGSVDMVLCDLPYETTRNPWDQALPFEPMWREYWRVCRPGAAVVLTATQPFSSALVCSQLDAFKYEWVWEKTAASGFLNAPIEPLRAHEHVLIFGRGASTYNPQKTQGHPRKSVAKDKGRPVSTYGPVGASRPGYDSTERYPRSVQVFAKDNRLKAPHPTQKPVALFEYLIRTYTNPGDVVLDNTAGSGTTAVAAENTGRRWICMERDETYYNGAICRIMESLDRKRAEGAYVTTPSTQDTTA